MKTLFCLEICFTESKCEQFFFFLLIKGKTVEKSHSRINIKFIKTTEMPDIIFEKNKFPNLSKTIQKTIE